MRPSLSSCKGQCPIPSGGTIEGLVRVPPSKSLTQRFLNLALLARQPTVLVGPLQSEDTELFSKALGQVGCQIALADDAMEIRPGHIPANGELFCGNNGTMLRFLTASLTAIPGVWHLDGSDRLRQRPLGPLVEALRSLGARIEYLETDGFAPLRISGGSLEVCFSHFDGCDGCEATGRPASSIAGVGTLRRSDFGHPRSLPGQGRSSRGQCLASLAGSPSGWDVDDGGRFLRRCLSRCRRRLDGRKSANRGGHVRVEAG